MSMKRAKKLSAMEFYKRRKLENGSRTVDEQEPIEQVKRKTSEVAADVTEGTISKTERNRRKRQRKRQRRLETREDGGGRSETKVALEPALKVLTSRGSKGDTQTSEESKQRKKKKAKKVSPLHDEQQAPQRRMPLAKAEKKEVHDEQEEEEEEEAGSPCDVLETIDPVREAENLLAAILGPIELEDFFTNYWEKKPLLVKRKDSAFYSDWFSTQEIDSILRDCRVMFTEHIDVTSYVDGVRETHNPEGRAFPAVVWDFYHCGCSVRMLCPQAFSENLAFKLNLLQEYFHCFVGANAYLTPAGTQGFAPHYDDIEAFVLQLEGKKTWKLHHPRNEDEKLARFSSRNFKQTEVGPPAMEVTLCAGDLLYFPRGMIHQALSPDDEYSLHLTVSTNQKNTWGDLLTKLLPVAIEKAMTSDVRYRAGLPPGYLRYMGSSVSKDRYKEERVQFTGHVNKLVKDLLSKHLAVDDACDEMGKQLVHDSLPPCLDESEAVFHVSQQGEEWSAELGEVVNAGEITPDTELRLVRATCMRLLSGPGPDPEDAGVAARLFHAMTNTRIYHETEPTFSAVSSEALPCIEKLLNTYPNFLRVENFPLPQLDEKISVASGLYDMGLVITRGPLNACEDSSDADLD